MKSLIERLKDEVLVCDGAMGTQLFDKGMPVGEAPEPWGPWSVGLPLVSGRAYPGLYGAYMHPWTLEDGGETVYFTMSRWGPYSVFLMRARLVKH